MMLPLAGTYVQPYRRTPQPRPLALTAYHVNLAAAILLKQEQSAIVEIDGQVFESPIVRIDFPGGGEDGTCLWVSGIVEEIVARWRGLHQ